LLFNLIAKSAACTAVVFEFAYLIMHVCNTKVKKTVLIMHVCNTEVKKTVSLEEVLNILQDTYIHMGTHISMVKQLGLSVSAQYNTGDSCYLWGLHLCELPHISKTCKTGNV
jgi:hypothetical protein